MNHDLCIASFKQTDEAQARIKESIMSAFLDAEKLYALCKLAHIRAMQEEDSDYLKLLEITCKNLAQAYEAIHTIISLRD